MTILDYVIEKKHPSFSVRTVKSATEEEVSGTLSRNSAICPQCKSVVDKKKLESVGKTTGFGRILTCIIESPGKGKTYRSPTKFDISCYARASETLYSPALGFGPDIPCEELPYLRSIFNVNVYGMDTWGKLFNDRQLLALLTICRSIHKAIARIAALQIDSDYGKAIASYLTLTLGRQADYSSTLCRWSPQGEFLANTCT